MSFGKSSPSVHSMRVTSHDQRGWSIILEHQCIPTHLNGSQFRQVYSITHITVNHSQTQHENNTRMLLHQTRVIRAKASLFITHCEWEYSSTPMKSNKTTANPFEWKSIQASLFNHSHHSQSLSNTTRGHSRNALSPNSIVLREGMSSHYSL